MRNLKLTLEYDGTEFHGFQRQPELRTVQGVLEDRFSRLLSESIAIVGAGRTDAGVHASGQVVNFHTTRPIEIDRLREVLNGALPDDLKVQQCEEVDSGFHARRRALSRTYRYTIVERCVPSPIRGRFALVLPGRLSVAKMRRAAAALAGKRDFAAFQGSGSETATTERTLLRLECARRADTVEITAEADSFLYNMVRNIAAALIEVGRGSLDVEAVTDALARRERLPHCPPAPACGLCLVQVSY